MGTMGVREWQGSLGGRNGRTPPFRTTILHSSWYTCQRQRQGCWPNISPHRTTFFFFMGAVFCSEFGVRFPSSALLCIKFASSLFSLCPSLIFSSQWSQEQLKGMIFFIGFYQSGLAPITSPTSKELETWSELELLYCASHFPWSVMNKNKLLLLRWTYLQHTVGAH